MFKAEIQPRENECLLVDYKKKTVPRVCYCVARTCTRRIKLTTTFYLFVWHAAYCSSTPTCNSSSVCGALNIKRYLKIPIKIRCVTLWWYWCL